MVSKQVRGTQLKDTTGKQTHPERGPCELTSVTATGQRRGQKNGEENLGSDRLSEALRPKTKDYLNLV